MSGMVPVASRIVAVLCVASAACAAPGERAARQDAVPAQQAAVPAEQPGAPPPGSPWAVPPPGDSGPGATEQGPPPPTAPLPAPRPRARSGCIELWQGQEVNCCVKRARQHCDAAHCAQSGGRCEPGACGSSHCARPAATGIPPQPAPGTNPAPAGGGGRPGGAVPNCAGPSPSPSHVCVRDCTGPVVRQGAPPPGWSWLSAEQAERRRLYGCPVCLHRDAQIATPSGTVAIARLVAGAAVWSVDEGGRRVRTRVAVVLSTPAPEGHQMAVVELSDGRTLRASPGHPDARGRAVGELQPGDELDGSTVRRVHREAYAGRTYDLVLDSGRLYWADGVLIDSTAAARSAPWPM